MKKTRVCAPDVFSYRGRLLDSEKKSLLDALVYHYEYQTPNCPFNPKNPKHVKIERKFRKFNKGPCCSGSSYGSNGVDPFEAIVHPGGIGPDQVDRADSFDEHLDDLASFLADKAKIAGGIQGQWGFRFSYQAHGDRLIHHTNFGFRSKGHGTKVVVRPPVVNDMIDAMVQHRDGGTSFVFYVSQQGVVTCGLCQWPIWVAGDKYTHVRCKK